MPQTEHYRFLSNVNNIKPSPILSHLDSQKRIASEKILGRIDKYKTEIVKYFDPIIFDILLQPKEYPHSEDFFVLIFDSNSYLDVF
jgi:flagellar motor switch protein FliG